MATISVKRSVKCYLLADLIVLSEDPDGKEKRRLKYLDQEKFDYIQNYLEQSREQTKDVDSQSVTTETSDSGMQGSFSASSESPEDPSGKISTKDIQSTPSKTDTFGTGSKCPS